MSNTETEPISQDVFALVTTRQGGAPVSPDEVRVEVEQSSLAVRPVGGFITDAVLSGRQVLYRPSEESLGTAKLVASHTMSPVGPSDELGGQHGIPRWLDYDVLNRSNENTVGLIQMEGITSPAYPGISKNVVVSPNRLVMGTVIGNQDGETDLKTSIGEHLYFSHPEGDADGLRINQKTIDELLGEGALSEIMDGKAQFWPGFFRGVEIGLSDGRRLGLSSSIRLNPSPRGVPPKSGMLFWHRKGTDSICFEPVFGVRRETGTATLRNRELVLPIGAAAAMTTRVVLLD